MQSRPPLTLPCRYGKYELLERVGSGGMAEVYRARLPGIAGFEKIVVVKRLHPHLAADRGMVRMFVEEAKLAALVQHPNIVQVFELDRASDGELYIVMEYVEGTDLRRLLRLAYARRRRVPPWLSVYIVAQVLDGLAFAHDLVDRRGRRRNIVHRDIAPDNIFISRLGTIKLGDFGVAKDDTRGPEPFADQLKGKFSYMAPETFLGRSLDHRSDIFAAGVVLWEALAQRPLFRGETSAETMQLVCNALRMPPSRHADDIPAELDRVVLDALVVDPDRRISSAQEMLARLLPLLGEMHANVGPLAVRRAIEALSAEAGEPPPLPPPEPDEEVSEDLIISEVSVELEAEPEGVSSGTSYTLIKPERRDVLTEDIPSPVPYDIPMPGQPSSVETADIVARKRLHEREDDLERLVRSAELWAPYAGTAPFWLRSGTDTCFGPTSFAEVSEILRSKISERTRETIELSSDGRRWTVLSRFLGLAFVDLLPAAAPLPRGARASSVKPVELATLFERIEDKTPTGRFRLYHCPVGAPAQGRFTEIHVIRGEPTHVAANDDRLDTPRQLVELVGLDSQRVDELLHEVLVADRPLSRVLISRLSLDLSSLRPRMMEARLEPLLLLAEVSYVFSPHRPEARPSFAPSLVALLPRHRAL